MSIKRMTAVWEHSEHKGSELLFMLAVADNANDIGVAWPGYHYLARKTRMARRSVMRLAATCAESGELWLLQRPRQRSNIYVVTVDLDIDDLKAAGEQALDMGAIPPTGSDILSPPPQVLAVVTRCHQVVTRCHHVVIPESPGGDTAMSPDPSLSVITLEEEEDQRLQDLWKAAKRQLQGRMTDATFNTHFVRSRLLPADNGAWRLRVDNENAAHWINRNHRRTIVDALRMVSGEEADRELEIVTE